MNELQEIIAKSNAAIARVTYIRRVLEENGILSLHPSLDRVYDKHRNRRQLAERDLGL